MWNAALAILPNRIFLIVKQKRGKELKNYHAPISNRYIKYIKEKSKIHDKRIYLTIFEIGPRGNLNAAIQFLKKNLI